MGTCYRLPPPPPPPQSPCRQWKSILIPTKLTIRCCDGVPTSQYFSFSLRILVPFPLPSSPTTIQKSNSMPTNSPRSADATRYHFHNKAQSSPADPGASFPLPNFKKQTRAALMACLLYIGFIPCMFPLSMSFCADPACCLPTRTTVTSAFAISIRPWARSRAAPTFSFDLEGGALWVAGRVARRVHGPPGRKRIAATRPGPVDGEK